MLLLVLGALSTSSEIDQIMRQADTDGDGKISFTEFVSMMNQRLFRRYEHIMCLHRGLLVPLGK